MRPALAKDLLERFKLARRLETQPGSFDLRRQLSGRQFAESGSWLAHKLVWISPRGRRGRGLQWPDQEDSIRIKRPPPGPAVSRCGCCASV
jgi:hypothetical protein